MRSALALTAILAAAPAVADNVYISIGSDTVDTVLLMGMVPIAETSDRFVIEVDEKHLDALSEEMHERHDRCGGFMVHASLEEALAPAEPERLVEYTLDRPEQVKTVLPQLEAARIESMIREMSSSKNRYYRSESGARASVWLRDLWRSFTPRTDVTVELFDHGYPQKSVIMTIPGTTRANEVVVIGGHLDSIAPGGTSSTAPGADDDASGVSTLTEVARVLLANDYRPERTVKFMAYAAEEVGLRGSLGIVRDFKKRAVNVVGALQLDMTNYQGSKKDIWLINDYTSATQNAFVVALIESYVGATWGWDACGYACSDHASWHRAGVPASMPFEARFREMNQSIHTHADTLARSNDNAEHAVKFARLGAAYTIELAKGTLGPTQDARMTSVTTDGCGWTAMWKWFAGLASFGIALLLWLRTSRVA